MLELGKLLASELEESDTLGRWMAHYLAERMTTLEEKSGSERVIADAEVADLVLRLWSLRRQLPSGRLPLAEVDEVEAAIARLSPERRPWAYFGAFSADTGPSTQETETSTTLKAAMLVDRLSGDLVHALIGLAAALAEDTDAAWVRHAEKFGDSALRTVRRLRLAESDSTDAFEKPDRTRDIQRSAKALASVVSVLATPSEAEGAGPPGESRG